MKLEDENGKLKLVLEDICTIEKVEADADKLRAHFNSHKIEGVEVSVDGVEELDTAYFQMLLSVKASTEELGVPFAIMDNSSIVDELCRLYGESFNKQYWTI